MLRVVISSLLIVNALFWGLYPHHADCKIGAFTGLKTCPSKYLHLGIGVLFYISAVLVAQQTYVQHIWF
jgi:hypothetical protein|uniref:Uncharacterized protein n=1 Tax=viral metagenome TaxID=1070528 RepID=A0A6C0C0T6_9ZZZZ